MGSIEAVEKAAREAQRAFEKRHLPTIWVTLEAPIGDIDLSECHCVRYWVPAGDELNGRASGGEWGYECDLTGATFKGREVLIEDMSDTDVERLERRLIEEYNEPPEAA